MEEDSAERGNFHGRREGSHRSPDGMSSRQELEALLGRLADGGMSGMGSGTLLAGRNAMQKLDADGDDTTQIEALQSLCESLSFGAEEAMALLGLRRVVPTIIALLSREQNPDLMLLATRAAAQMAEHPGTALSLVQYGATECMCNRLTCIEYIDLAEVSLEALEKLSHHCPRALLERNALQSALTFVDFFSEGIQRVAASLATRVCASATSSDTHLAPDAGAMLNNLFAREDESMSSNACRALKSLAVALRNRSALESLLTPELIRTAVQFLQRRRCDSAPALKLLRIACQRSENARQAATEADVEDMLCKALANVIEEGSRMSDNHALEEILRLAASVANGSNFAYHALALARSPEVETRVKLLALECARRVGCPRLDSIGKLLARLMTTQDIDVERKAVQVAREVAEKDQQQLHQLAREGVRKRAEELAAKNVRHAAELARLLEYSSPGKEEALRAACANGKAESAILELDKCNATGHEIIESSVLDFLLQLVTSTRESKDWIQPLLEKAGSNFVRSVRRALEDSERLGDSRSETSNESDGLAEPFDEDIDTNTSKAHPQDDRMEGEEENEDGEEEEEEEEEEAEEEAGNGDDEGEEYTDFDGNDGVGDVQAERESSDAHADHQSGSTRGASQHNLEKLSKPLKVKLQKAEDEHILTDFGSHILLVEPLATLSALESFLLPRIKLMPEQNQQQSSLEISDNRQTRQIGRRRNLRASENAQDAGMRLSLYTEDYDAPVAGGTTVLEAALFSRPDMSWQKPLIFRYKCRTNDEPSSLSSRTRNPYLQIGTEFLGDKPKNLASVVKEVHSLWSGHGAATSINKEARAPLAILLLLRLILKRLGRRVGAQEAAALAATEEAWQSPALSSKLSRMASDPILLVARPLPLWASFLLHHTPFLFPVELRRKVFLATSFSLQRSLFRLQQQQPASEGGNAEEAARRGDPAERRTTRLPRHKATLRRPPEFLEDAINILAETTSSESILEVHFSGEMGTGTGPTLEFFSTLGSELQRADLKLWRNVYSSMTIGTSGLFPISLRQCESLDDERRTLYRTAGKAAGKAIADGRIFDFPIAPVTWRALRGEQLDLYDFAEIEPEIASTLLQIEQGAVADVSEYGLTFALPLGDGSGLVELEQGKGDVPVTNSNAQHFLRLAKALFVGKGVETQLREMRVGFEEALPLNELRLLENGEEEWMIQGEDTSTWNRAELEDKITFKHGISSSSKQAVWLLDIMMEMTFSDRRALLQWLTGSPRLPPGGLGALQPKLTIVKKSSYTSGHSTPSSPQQQGEAVPSESAEDDADSNLPSANSCASYLKLPLYSSKEVMRERLQYAIHEGTGFYLS